MSGTLKDASRREFTAPDEVSWEALQAGCLQRIAEATETTADTAEAYREAYVKERTLRRAAEAQTRLILWGSVLAGVIAWLLFAP